jgi:hypothetical protein
MIDKDIAESIEEIVTRVNTINSIMASLYEKNVEIRIAYKDADHGQPPKLDLWRATEHINYLKKADTHE